jgi:hypothetical protein
MKNPFEKKDNTVLILALFGGIAIAGTLAYLYLTESGADTRESLKRKLKREGRDLAAGVISKRTGIKKKTLKKVANHVVK